MISNRQQRFMNRVNMSGFVHQSQSEVISKMNTTIHLAKHGDHKMYKYEPIIAGQSVVGGLNKVMRLKGNP